MKMSLVRQSGVLAAVAAIAVSAGCASTVGEPSAPTLTAALTGAAETPGPGDPDGSGSAELTVNATTLEVCHKLTVASIAPAVAAHVHRGAAGQAGPPVIPLTTPATGASEGCATVAAELATDLLANPQNYYVNVHTPEHPPGAVRGQLRR